MGGLNKGLQQDTRCWILLGWQPSAADVQNNTEKTQLVPTNVEQFDTALHLLTLNQIRMIRLIIIRMNNLLQLNCPTPSQPKNITRSRLAPARARPRALQTRLGARIKQFGHPDTCKRANGPSLRVVPLGKENNM